MSPDNAALKRGGATHNGLVLRQLLCAESGLNMDMKRIFSCLYLPIYLFIYSIYIYTNINRNIIYIYIYTSHFSILPKAQGCWHTRAQLALPRRKSRIQFCAFWKPASFTSGVVDVLLFEFAMPIPTGTTSGVQSSSTPKT